jgi:hypothetical protein
MHREVRGSFYLYLLAIGALMLSGSGCSFVKMPQGWVLNTGWSLEFHRMPFNVSCERPCAPACEPGCNANCGTECDNPSRESGQPTVAPQQVEPAPTLHKVEEGSLPEKGDSAGLTNVLKRRGRLGICSTCGKMGRFKEPPKPAEPATTPVMAKFHPVPAGPVFCPRPLTTTPVAFQSPPGQKKSAPKKIPQPSQPEVIPPPPPAAQINRLEQAPRELDVPTEPPDWVFAAPENGTEGQSQSQSKALGATRR